MVWPENGIPSVAQLARTDILESGQSFHDLEIKCVRSAWLGNAGSSPLWQEFFKYYLPFQPPASCARWSRSRRTWSRKVRQKIRIFKIFFLKFLANFLNSPELARMAGSGPRNRHNASYALGLSLSADTIGTVLVDDDEEMATPQAARDDGRGLGNFLKILSNVFFLD